MNVFDPRQLDDRRKELRMTFAALSVRSGVPLRTVQRILYGEEQRLDFSKVHAIANALGGRLDGMDLRWHVPAQQFRRQQAERKAQQLVDMTQATSGLEAQAVDPSTFHNLTAQTVNELLSGSLELWRDL